MVERDLDDAEDAKAIRFSGGQFQLVVETLDGAERDEFSGAKPVEDQAPMNAQRARNLLHRLDPRAHDAAAPGVQEPPGPASRRVVPEKLEVFFEASSTESVGTFRLG